MNLWIKNSYLKFPQKKLECTLFSQDCLWGTVWPKNPVFPRLSVVHSVWYMNITGMICSSLWTPFSDTATEGHFLNMYDGSEAKYLPWDRNQPNGGSDENHVSISLQSSLHWDRAMDNHFCSSCLLDRSLLLRMDGLCEDSYIGDYHKVVWLFL